MTALYFVCTPLNLIKLNILEKINKDKYRFKNTDIVINKGEYAIFSLLDKNLEEIISKEDFKNNYECYKTFVRRTQINKKTGEILNQKKLGLACNYILSF